MTIVKIIGIIIASVIVVVMLVVGLVIWWFRRAMKNVAETKAPPSRISLEREERPQWRSGSVIEGWRTDFHKLGFQDVGAFSIPEIGGLTFFALAHPDQKMYVVIYDHQKIPPNFDVCCEFENTDSITGVNTTFGDTMDRRPGYTRISLEKASPREVVEAVLAKVREDGRALVFDPDFVRTFRTSYARSMNWRLQRGGVTRDEIKKQATRDGRELTDEQLEDCYTSMREQYVEGLQEGCIAEFLETTRPEAMEWERVRYDTFAVPETLELDELVELLQAQLFLDEEQVHQLDQLKSSRIETALDVLDSLLAQKTTALPIEKIGEVQEPVRAYILRRKPAKETANP